MQQQVSIKSGRAEKLEAIQFGRGIAACLVVFFHAGRMLDLPQYTGHATAMKSLFTFGNAGVDFFFVLSGFVIFHVHQSDIGRPARLGHYLWRRVTRIYPMYWLVTAFIIALAVLKRDWMDLNFAHVATSLLLLPSQQEPLLGVGWTLIHEVLFYAVFAVAILSRRAGIVAGLIWLGLVLAGIFYPTDIALAQFVADPYHLEFAFGIFAALATRRFGSPHAWGFAAAGLVLFAGTAWMVDLQALNDAAITCRLLFAIGSAGILYGVSVAEKAGQLRLPDWAVYLGAASYSIYLVHTIAIGFAARALFIIPAAHHADTVMFFVISALAIAAGCLAYQFIERPLQHAVRQSAMRWRTAPAVLPHA